MIDPRIVSVRGTGEGAEMKLCSAGGCRRPHYGKSLCQMHYKRVWRRPDRPVDYLDSLPARFWTHVEITDTCWLWTGSVDHDGYGQLRYVGRHFRAHRASFEHFRHALTPDLVPDHLCRNRRCVNPLHLEAVTSVENVMRGEGITATNARKTHCIHGHALDGDNLYRLPNGGRECRTCRREIKRRYRARNKRVAA